MKVLVAMLLSFYEKTLKNKPKCSITVFISITLVLLSCVSSGCSKTVAVPEKEKDLEYTVVEPLEQPDEVKKAVEERKEEPFRFVYSDGADMYLVVGYGEQSTGGYSIAVESVYLTKEPNSSIYVDLTLLGPDKKEEPKKAKTYPYIVLKTEAREESVVFR